MIKLLFIYSFLFILSINTNLYSQKTIVKENFNYVISEEEGDLNRDGRMDRVILEMDKDANNRPIRLQIFMSQKNSKNFNLDVSTTKLIESQIHTNKKNIHAIPDFFIEDGHLQMLTDIDNQKSSYIFRYHNNSFELISISRVTWDGKNTTTETEIDLSNGIKTETKQGLGSDKKYKKEIKIKPSNPLPKIQDLTYTDLVNY